jgi:hypothetical protein
MVRTDIAIAGVIGALLTASRSRARIPLGYLLSEIDSSKWSFNRGDDAGQQAIRHGESNVQAPEDVLHAPIVRMYGSQPTNWTPCGEVREG